MGWFKDANRNTAKKNIQAQADKGDITQDEAKKRIAGVDEKAVYNDTKKVVEKPSEERIQEAAKPAPSATSRAAMANIANSFKPISFADEVGQPFNGSVTTRPAAQNQDRIQMAAAKVGISPEQAMALMKELGEM